MRNTASQPYVEHFAAILAMSEAMPALITAMAADAQRVDWSHVGDMERLHVRMRDVTDLIAIITRAHSDVR